jgi:hypothetical protein
VSGGGRRRKNEALPWTFHLTDFRFMICAMANPNSLAGVVPQVVRPKNDGETTISQFVEKMEGQVALDTYVKAHDVRARGREADH